MTVASCCPPTPLLLCDPIDLGVDIDHNKNCSLQQQVLLRLATSVVDCSKCKTPLQDVTICSWRLQIHPMEQTILSGRRGLGHFTPRACRLVVMGNAWLVLLAGLCNCNCQGEGIHLVFGVCAMQMQYHMIQIFDCLLYMVGNLFFSRMFALSGNLSLFYVNRQLKMADTGQCVCTLNE